MIIRTHLLADDGLVPNNPTLPLIVVHEAWSRNACAEGTVIACLADNGWMGAWVDGIYPFHHYHARSHEVLVIARGRATVQFGGPTGPEIEVGAGDAMVIPAGVGHCRLSSSADLSVVGAYPAGQEDWDLKRATADDRAVALREIANVALPDRDPIGGERGAVISFWLGR